MIAKVRTSVLSVMLLAMVDSSVSVKMCYAVTDNVYIHTIAIAMLSTCNITSLSRLCVDASIAFNANYSMMTAVVIAIPALLLFQSIASSCRYLYLVLIRS